MYELSLTATPNQEFLVTLDGQNCTINLYQRDDYIFLDLTVGQEVVKQGAICMPLVGIIQKPANFKGQLYLYDSYSPSSSQTLATWENLGERYKLVYVTESELNA